MITSGCDMKQIFEIGIVAGTHGIEGEVKFYPYSDDTANIMGLEYLLDKGNKMMLQKARISGKFVLLKFKDINDLEAASKLKGTVLSVERVNAAPLSENKFYVADLLGCRVFDNDEYLGTVYDIMKTGSNDVYCIVDDSGNEILVPALKTVVKEISIFEKRINVVLPKGLTDDDYI